MWLTAQGTQFDVLDKIASGRLKRIISLFRDYFKGGVPRPWIDGFDVFDCHATTNFASNVSNRTVSTADVQKYNF